MAERSSSSCTGLTKFVTPWTKAHCVETVFIKMDLPQKYNSELQLLESAEEMEEGMGAYEAKNTTD